MKIRERFRVAARPAPILWLWILVSLVPSLLLGRTVAAQDCGFEGDEWSDVQRFRRCLAEFSLDQWESPDGETLLHQAALQTSNPTIILLLLDAGWDPQARTDDGGVPLHFAAMNNNPMVVSHLLDASAAVGARDNDGYTALHFAAAQNDNERVTLLLIRAGADPMAESNDGRTPLHSALIHNEDLAVVSVLAEAGAVDVLPPLHRAVLQGDPAAVRPMIADGVDTNSADHYGWHALHFAVTAADLEVVAALLSAGADPNAVAGDGSTPLHYAAMKSDDPTIIALLLEAGADPQLRNGQRQLPGDLLVENEAIKNSEVARRLPRSAWDPRSEESSSDRQTGVCLRPGVVALDRIRATNPETKRRPA